MLWDTWRLNSEPYFHWPNVPKAGDWPGLKRIQQDYLVQNAMYSWKLSLHCCIEKAVPFLRGENTPPPPPPLILMHSRRCYLAF